jgi:hypothetical protein
MNLPDSNPDRVLSINPLFAIILALLSALPVMVAHYPQMSDYPAHLARYYVMIDGGRSADLARYYAFEWKWTGNVGVDLLIQPFAALFGVELGARIIAGLIPPLTGLGILAVEWALRKRIGVGSMLAMAFIWSPMMLIGLVNFALGLAAALWAFALWIWLEGRRWRWAVFLPIGVVVWLCHMSAWGILGVLVFGREWARDKGWRACVVPWPLTLPLTAMVLIPGTGGEFSYGALWWVYKQAIWLKAMRDSSYPLDFLGLVAVVAVLALALVNRRVDGRLGWAAAMMLGLSLLLPRHISGGDYVDYRMITSGLLVACLAVDWRVESTRYRAILWAAPALYLLRLMVTTLSWQADSAETGRILVALDHVPQGARVASAVLVPTGTWWLNHFEHIGDYAVLRNHARVNANFAVAQIHMLKMVGGGYADPSQRLLQPISAPVDLAHFAPAKDADFLWYVGARQPDTWPDGAVVIWRSEHSVLARLAKGGHSD